MSDDLRILISADLNRGLSLREINNSIKQISKHPSLQSIKLKVDIDPKILQTLQQFNANLNKVNHTIGQQAQSVNATTTAINKESDAIKNVTHAQAKWNEEQKKTFKDAFGKTTGVQTTFGKGNEKQIVNFDSDGKSIKSSVYIENQKKDLEDYNKLVKQNLADEEKRYQQFLKSAQERYNIEKDIEERWQKNLHGRDQKEANSAQKTLEDRLKLERETEERWLKNLSNREKQEHDLNLKRIQDIDRAHHDAFLEKERRESHLGSKLVQDQVRAYDLAKVEDAKFNQQRFVNEQKFARMQQDTINKIETARMKFGHHKGVNEQLDKVLYGITQAEIEGKKFSATTKNWDQHIRNANTQIGKSTVGLKAMRVESLGIIEGLKTAAIKFPVWMIAATAFYAPLRGMQKTISQLLEIDKQMTSLMRVSNGEIDRHAILKESIALAERLGNTIIDINTGIENFARQGFRGEGLMAMTEAATLFSNISEMNVEEASSGLTAILKGFQMLPEEIMTAVDAINEVNVISLLAR